MSQRAATALGLLDAVEAAVLVLQGERILWGNSAAAILTGYAPPELQGKSVPHLLPALENGEQTLINAAGSLVSIRLALKPTELDGEPAVFATLTPLPTAPLPPAQTIDENIYRRAIEDTQQGFFLLKSVRNEHDTIVDFTFADVNAHGAQMAGYPPDLMKGESVSKLFPPSFNEGYLDVFVDLLETHKVLDHDMSFTYPNGEVTWFHRQVVPLEDQLAVFLHSITERKAIEHALRDSENRYRALFDQSNDYVTLLTFDGIYLQVNHKFADTLGYSPEEMIGKPISAFMPRQEAKQSAQRREALLRGEEVPNYVRVFQRRDGTKFLGEINLSIVRDTDGKPLYVQSIIRDVTARETAEKAMRESEERYRIISELIFDYAYSMRVEPDGTFVHEWITESFTRITGYTWEEIDSTGNFALYHPEDAAKLPDALARVLDGEATSDEYRIITKLGNLRWIHLLRQPVWDEAQNRVVRMFGVAQDITERKAWEDQLRSSEEKYRLIAENATDMITRTAANGVRTYVSSASIHLLGYEPDELIGQTSYQLIHPDDMDSVRHGWEALQISTSPVTFICRMRHKDGHYVWFEVVSQTIFDPVDGSITEYVAVSRDISQRKQMDRILLEQERLRFELQKEQELNAVKSNLMRTISHEFRTPLTLVTIATDFLDMYIDRLDTERRKERLDSIREQVKRLSEMLNDISFVVQGTLHRVAARKAPLDLEAYCRAILEETQVTVGKMHQFVYTVKPDAVQGIADKALLQRILSNLLSNAVKYSPENSVISLKLSRQDDDILFEVSDEGIGISPEEQKHVFEPFYRSRSVIDGIGGTGLGLSIVKDCVDLQGGSVAISSTPGTGTTFTVRIPQTPT
jgi:PAS domain S-box-containing protein